MRILYSLLATLFCYACSPQQTTGPEEIHWDRQVCTRCAMAIGDNKYATQVRGGAAKKIYQFDDIGCAVIWLDQQPWKTDKDTEIWVADYRNGQWIDARRAWFERGRHSPMGYGLGARNDSIENSLNFNQAIEDIQATENRLHVLGKQHQHAAGMSK